MSAASIVSSPYLTVKEAAEFMRVGLSTVYGFISDEKSEFPYVKAGARVLIDQDELKNWLKRKK